MLVKVAPGDLYDFFHVLLGCFTDMDCISASEGVRKTWSSMAIIVICFMALCIIPLNFRPTAEILKELEWQCHSGRPDGWTWLKWWQHPSAPMANIHFNEIWQIQICSPISNIKLNAKFLWRKLWSDVRYTPVDIIIKLCCYVILSTRSPSGVSGGRRWLPREIWWTVSCNYTVLFLSCDVKNTKFNQYLPVDLMSLNVSNSRFRKPVMFWKWHHHGVALWCHGRGAGHNCLLLTTASNVNCWADVANHVTRLWQAGDTENFKRSRVAQSRDKTIVVVPS